jgi:hypothetical protein
VYSGWYGGKQINNSVDGELIGRIGKARDANDKYETIEKIGKGAYGNVSLVAEWFAN